MSTPSIAPTRAEVPGRRGAAVEDPVVLGEQVHVVQDDAVKVGRGRRLQEAGVEQGGAVEGPVVRLKKERGCLCCCCYCCCC